jgi:SAM-dependent methyltransferase
MDAVLNEPSPEPMSTDHHWELWGARDPYFGVLTHPKFRTAEITEEAREEFFVGGQVHAAHVLNVCRAHLDAAFNPQRVLDFGCGVGRIAIPFASGAAEVVGVDVSPSMLAEARRNCDARGAPHVRLLPSDDTLSAVDGQFDLVHSCIVLQHIEVPRGRELFRQLVERVRPGGIAAIQVTFGWDVHAATFGLPPPPVPEPPPGPLAGVKAGLRQLIGSTPPSSTPAADTASADPEMQMNFYNMSELLFIAQQAGTQAMYTELTDHGGALGAFMFFRKAAPVAA